jgi:hypothetical protein
VSRSIKVCANPECGETREIAAHGLCFKCYRTEERKRERENADDLWARPDSNAKDVRIAQRKTRKGLMKMMDAIEEIEECKLVPAATLEEWRRLLRPEVARIARSLGEPEENRDQEDKGDPLALLADQPSEQPSEVAEPVNGEQEDEGELVTQSADGSGDQVNSEQKNSSEPLPEPEPILPQVNSEQPTQSERSPDSTGEVPQISDVHLVNPEQSEQVNSEQKISNEPVHSTNDQTLLPPTVPQKISKVRKRRSSSHAA